jgi:hypothetical protein
MGAPPHHLSVVGQPKNALPFTTKIRLNKERTLTLPGFRRPLQFDLVGADPVTPLGKRHAVLANRVNRSQNKWKAIPVLL